MKPKIIPFIILLMLVIVFWLWPEPHTTENQNPNMVSLAVDQADKVEKSKKQPIKPQPTITEEFILRRDESLQTEPIVLTYLDVYRMKRQFSMCEQVIYRMTEDDAFDVVADFNHRIERLKSTHPTWPTPQQLNAVKAHALSCQRLLSRIEAIEDINNNTKSRGYAYINLRSDLNQKLLSMQPRTVKEKGIAQVLQMAETWQHAFEKVLAASKGDETQNLEEIEGLRLKIRDLDQERSDLSRSRRENSELDFSQRFREIWQATQALEREITTLSLVDAAARQQAITDFNVINDMLFEQLKSKDPDVFYEAQITLEMSQSNLRNFGFSPYKGIGKGKYKVPFIEYISPAEVIKSLIGINDNEIFALVINYATKLYHCELGADCAVDGEWNLSLCHGGYNEFYEAACYMDLVSFYQQELMNENQWQDVQYILSIIRGLYES